MMFLTESYINRLKKLSGLEILDNDAILAEAENLYQNSNKRVKFDQNLMKQAIEGGIEIGLVFQSNNKKYKMPIWKTRIVQPVAMGYDKNGDLVVRGIHVEGQSEKKAIETGSRSAQANNEWRLFKVSNIKSMFFTGRLFDEISLPGYNPQDSAMTEILAKFDANKAKEYQKTLDANRKTGTAKLPEPQTAPVKTAPKPPAKKAPEKTTTAPKPPVKAPAKSTNPDDVKALQQKIDKLNKLL